LLCVLDKYYGKSPRVSQRDFGVKFEKKKAGTSFGWEDGGRVDGSSERGKGKGCSRGDRGLESKMKLDGKGENGRIGSK
jgi:hypothetical protein